MMPRSTATFWGKLRNGCFAVQACLYLNVLLLSIPEAIKTRLSESGAKLVLDGPLAGLMGLQAAYHHHIYLVHRSYL